MRITSKGQVTIPQDVRERAGFMPGTDVEFVFEGAKVVIRKRAAGKRPTRGQALVVKLRGAGDFGMSAIAATSVPKPCSPSSASYAAPSLGGAWPQMKSRTDESMPA